MYLSPAFSYNSVPLPRIEIHRRKAYGFKSRSGLHLLSAHTVIVLDLICDQDHRFEAWFASSDAFDTQLATGLVSCPHCASRQVRRLPSAPYVQTSSHSAPRLPEPDPAAIAARLVDALRSAASQSEDVGERFAEEARRIHHGDAEERAIRGKANQSDVRELIEEGIPVLPVPPDKEDLH